jgi:hypothetical protein
MVLILLMIGEVVRADLKANCSRHRSRRPRTAPSAAPLTVSTATRGVFALPVGLSSFRVFMRCLAVD